MRTIKFRGKHLCGQWYFGNLIVREVDSPVPETKQAYRCVCIGDIEDGSEEEVEENTIGQFTGLHDKNGKEIYEGDIVQCGRFIYRVQYDADRIASFYISRDGDFYNHYFGEAMLAEECEVIGNIYDTKTEDKK